MSTIGGQMQAARFDGRVAIVTGGASGMGEAVAHTLANRGAHVVIADKDAERTPRVAAEIRANSGSVEEIIVDLREEDAVKDLIGRVVARHGRIDAIDNNAAELELTAQDPDLVNLGSDILRATLEGNVIAPFLVCKYALPHMLERGSGSIVNMASISGMAGEPNLTAYGVSKAAVIQLTRMIATQYGKQGIRCNAISPSLINTENNKRYMPTELWGVYERNHLTPYIGEPQDVANVVAFLLSDEARFMTGHVVPVDGGMLGGAPFVSDKREHAS